MAAIELIVGLGALYGGYGLLTDPEGMGAKQSWLDGSVFPDFTIPGLFLLIVIGGGMLVAAAAAMFSERYAAAAAATMGAVLLLWGLVETVTLGWLGGAQLVLLDGVRGGSGYRAHRHGRSSAALDRPEVTRATRRLRRPRARAPARTSPACGTRSPTRCRTRR